MNEIVTKENMIFEISGKQVILHSEISAFKCYYCLYDRIMTHYDIVLPISVFNIGD